MVDRLGEKPYIGVTGITTAQEARAVAQAFVREGLIDEKSSHRGMIGVLVSERSLTSGDGESIKHPSIGRIRQILMVTQEQAFRTLHYHTYHPSDVAEQLKRLLDQNNFYSEGLCDGVQLNIKWPPVNEIEKTRAKFPDLKIILQLGPKTLTEHTPSEIADNLTPYIELIDYALIDPSAGNRRIFGVNTVTPLHNLLKDKHPRLPVVFAGGFDAKNVGNRLWVLSQTVGTRNFSIDAEGGLRIRRPGQSPTPISIARASHYIHNAASFFHQRAG